MKMGRDFIPAWSSNIFFLIELFLWEVEVIDTQLFLAPNLERVALFTLA
jgi:hypothetical protein